MLDLELSAGGIVHIGADIKVKLRSIDLDRMTAVIGFEAPRDVTIDRDSVRKRRIAAIKESVQRGVPVK